MAFDPKVRMDNLMNNAPFALRYDSKTDFFKWQEKARRKLAELVSYECTGTDPDFRIEWTHKEDGYTEHRFLFETEPDVTSIGHILIPDSIKEKAPVIICLQGHSKGMHISLGRPKYEGDEIKIKTGDRDFAIQIVRRGQIALALEQRGFGERGGNENGTVCAQPAVQAMLMGRTLIGQRCWDISRAIDVVAEHFPVADMNRIACMGNSGGGTATIYAAALDTRIKEAMPSCAFCGFKASIGDRLHCLCNYVPGIMNWFDMGDIASLIAPRALIVVNGKEDHLFPLHPAIEQMNIVTEAYRLAGAEEKIAHVTGQEGHRFYANDSWPVFDELTGWRG